MRALTQKFKIDTVVSLTRNNEVLAREGIDTPSGRRFQICSRVSNNEVLAREGIDTYCTKRKSPSCPCNNEVLAREGIDT